MVNKNMKLGVFKILEPTSREFLEIAAKRIKLDLSQDKYKNYVHPQEDYLLQSGKYPIFAVADGVTLELDSEGNYPNPSPAGEVARIFCESVIKEAEKIYDQFSELKIEQVFKKANGAVGEYNRAQGRSKETSNFWDFDLLAATGAFVVVKKDVVFWASICDSYVAKFDNGGRLKFKSPECWTNAKKNLPKNWEKIDGRERSKIIRKIYRNGINEKGELIGYGVITGEVVAQRYLNRGSFKINEKELIFLFTDGFENYFNLPEFIKLFISWSPKINSWLKSMSAELIKHDAEKFGHERTLFAIFTGKECAQ